MRRIRPSIPRDGFPSSPLGYENEPMTRERAYEIAMAFGIEFRLPCRPRPNGEGFDAVIPLELIENACIRRGCLLPAPPAPKPRPTSVYRDRT